MRPGSPDEFSFLVLNYCLETFPASEDCADDCWADLGCADDYSVDKCKLLDVFCSDPSQCRLLGKAAKAGENLADMLGVFGIFHPHLGCCGGAGVCNEIVWLFDYASCESWVE